MRKYAPEWLDAHLLGIAQEDNEAKKKGFYVDLHDDGTFTVPHEIDRPDLRGQIWCAADMVRWCLDEDALFASLAGRPRLPTREMEDRLAAVLARGPDG